MRELEFLPAWYPQLRHKKRITLIQTWLCVAMLLGLALSGALTGRNVHAAEASLDRINNQMTQTDAQLQKLDELLELEKQWQQQARIIQELGVHVQAARMIATLDEQMSKEMAIKELALDNVEQIKPVTTLADAKAAQKKPRLMKDRLLKVRLQGLAPSDVDLANFLARLGKIPFLQDVAMTYAREKAAEGHLMREFEVTFSMNLNAPVEVE